MSCSEPGLSIAAAIVASRGPGRCAWVVRLPRHLIVQFEWDPEKANANETTHEVSFLEASEVFDDDLSSTAPDPDHSAAESRYLIFGCSKGGRHLVVSFTERGDRIRLISARTMTPRERKAYEQ